MKKVSILLVITLLFAFIVPDTVLAKDVDNLQALNISTSNIDRNYDGVIVTNTNVSKFNDMNINDIMSYDMLLLCYTDMHNVKDELLLESIDNGSVIMIYGTHLPIEELQIDFLGSINDKAANFSNNLGNECALFYVYKTNNTILTGGVLDCTNQKLRNRKTGEYTAIKDIENKDVNVNEIKLDNYDVMVNIKDCYEGIESNNRFMMNIPSDSDQVSTLMPPLPATYIKGDYWTDLGAPYGKLINTAYLYKHRVGTKSYWDIITSMIVQPLVNNNISMYAVHNMKSKIYANYSNQDIIDYIELPSNSNNFTVTLQSSGVVNLAYSSSTTALFISNSVGTKQVQFTATPGILSHQAGIPRKFEPGARATNTSGNFVFRIYTYAYFCNRSELPLPDYETPYWYTTFTVPDF